MVHGPKKVQPLVCIEARFLRQVFLRRFSQIKRRDHEPK